MEIGTTLHGFVLQSVQEVPDLKSTAYLFAHEKSGARLLYLANDDVEKVFSIAFKTIPGDNTGVFHILEHSVLCGSEKYPVKEPFLDLLKTSMQTFLNAMTFPDKTMYPVASPNEKDFTNLMGVYMDAVLHPRIYQKKEIFMQEGWHLELPEEGEPYFNGVVYNEMKGVYSNADSLLEESVTRGLFPDNTYSSNSGGWPAEIPTLTYEHFLAEHTKYYHPENSYIFLWGQMDLESKLAFLDDEYLSHYERLHNEFDIPDQQPLGFSKIEDTYMVGEGEPLENNALVGCGFLAGGFGDREDNLAMELILDTLASTNESPLKKAILAGGWGQEFSVGLQDGIKQAMVLAILRKADEHKADDFLAALKEEIGRICEAGIDRAALNAALNVREFACRENDHYGPAGIGLAVEAMNGWLYGDDPVPYLSALGVIDSLRAKFETDYPEQLLRRVMIDNPHTTMVVLMPSATMAEEQSRAEAERAAAYKASLTDEQLEQIKAENEALRIFQNTEDTPELKATLPTLALSDVQVDPPSDIPTCTDVRDGVTYLFHDLPTNGIVYASYYFDIGSFPMADVPAVSFLTRVLGNLPTESYSAIDLDTAVKTDLGALDFSATAIRDRFTGKPRAFVAVRASALASKTERIPALVEECCLRTRFSPEEVRQLLQQEVIYGEQYLVGAGHRFAMLRASAAASKAKQYDDAIDGYGYLEYVRAALADFGDGTAFCAKLTELAGQVFGSCLGVVSCSCSKNEYIAFRDLPMAFEAKTEKEAQTPTDFAEIPAKSAIKIPASVAFNGAAMDLGAAGCVRDGKLDVVGQIVSLDYLWNAVRVRGGAYGVGMMPTDENLLCFYSYRDPSVKKTVDAYVATAEYLRAFEADEQTMTGYIIGAVSGADRPLRPKTQARVGDIRFLSHVTYAYRAARRAEALSATAEDVKAWGDKFAAAAEHLSLCTIASAEKIDADAGLFDKVIG